MISTCREETCGDLEDFCAEDSESLTSNMERYEVRDMFAFI